MKKLSFVISLLFLMAVFMAPLSVSAAESAGIKPGSFLYGFVTTFEKVNLFFTFNPEKKAEKALKYADKRLAEAEAVAGDENSDAVKKAISGYEKNIALAAEASKKVKDEAKAENLLNLIADNTSKHQEILSDVLSKVPEEAKEAITKAIEASKKGQEEAIKKIAELKGEVGQLKKEIEELKKQTAENKQTKIELQKTTVSVQKPSKTLSNKEIIAKVKPAVIYIETNNGSGSGMILSMDGFILTNAHVVSEASIVKIKLLDGRTLAASVIGRDENIDLAVLKIEGNNFIFVELGDSDAINQGDEVFTFGFPFGIEGDVSFKEGTISRRIENYFETSAEIHPGNSGGPLVNRYGQVIGVNTAIFGKSISGVQIGETIKLAIPINFANTIIPSLKTGRVVLAPKENKVSKSNNSCLALKSESDKLVLTLQETSVLTTTIENDFRDDGKKENPVTVENFNFDYPYNKMSAKRASFYKKLDQLDVRVTKVESTLAVANLLSESRLAFNKGTGIFREAFDLKLAGFKYLTSDAQVYFNGSIIIPRSEIDKSQTTLTNSINKALEASLSFIDGTSALKIIQIHYKYALSKAGCK